MATDADLIIVGAGPAGAAAACHFARMHFRVVLIDQHRFPRDKVCGDFVGPRALEELDRLGLSTQPPFRDANRIRRAEFYLGCNKIAGQKLPHADGLRDYGLCVPRFKMDRAIVQAAVAAGARLIEESRVTGYDTDKEGVTVTYQRSREYERLRARLLIGADGSTSAVARTLRGRPPPRRDRIVAVRAYFDGVQAPLDQAHLYVDSPAFPGYYWIFPTGANSANVGVGILLETWPPPGKPLQHFLTTSIQASPAMRALLSGSTMRGEIVGWPLATFNPRLPVVADRVALIGDAAGLISPLNGEGIQYALQSARWSAEELSRLLADDRVSAPALTRYGARVHAEMRLDMAISRLLVDFSRNRVLNPLWLSALAVVGRRAVADPEYADVFGGVLAGIAPSRDMLTVSFAWRTLQQAAAMIGRTTARDALKGVRSMLVGSARHPMTSVDWFIRCGRSALDVAVLMTPIRAPAPRAPHAAQNAELI